MEGGWRKGPWTTEEDRLLVEYVKLHGEGKWNAVATLAGLKRNGKSCRLRWVNYLRPDLKRGRITPYEETIILHLHATWGNRWSTIARSLPGRTDNEIKNYWRTHFKKKGKPCYQNSEKVLARLLKRQQFRQQQQQCQEDEMGMKKIMSRFHENDTAVSWRSLIESSHEVIHPNTLGVGEQQVIQPEAPNHEMSIWNDVLWNMDDLHGYNTINRAMYHHTLASHF